MRVIVSAPQAILEEVCNALHSAHTVTGTPLGADIHIDARPYQDQTLRRKLVANASDIIRTCYVQTAQSAHPHAACGRVCVQYGLISMAHNSVFVFQFAATYRTAAGDAVSVTSLGVAVPPATAHTMLSSAVRPYEEGAAVTNETRNLIEAATKNRVRTRDVLHTMFVALLSGIDQ